MIYSGIKEIGLRVKESYRAVQRLIWEEDFPAWRRKEKGAWKALEEDIVIWERKQRDKYKK